MPSTGRQVLVVADRPHRAAVGKRLVHREVEPRVGRSSSRVPSSGQLPSETAARPQAGQRKAGRSTPSWKSSSSTRASDAASSVCSQPDSGAARCDPPLHASARSPAASSFASASSRTGCDGCEQLGRAGLRLCRCPADERRSRASAESASVNSDRMSSEQTSTIFGALQLAPAAVELLAPRPFRCSWTSFSM